MIGLEWKFRMLLDSFPLEHYKPVILEASGRGTLRVLYQTHSVGDNWLIVSVWSCDC